MKLSPPTKPSELLAGTSTRGPAASPARPVGPRPVRRPLGKMHWFALIVLLPTLLVGSYYALIAANLYESEARYLVRSRTPPSGAGAAAGLLGGGGAAAAMRAGADEMRAVNDFLASNDAVAGLRRTLDLVGIWRRPEADLLARLWWEEPEAERLRRYFRRRVTVEFNIETNIATMKVLAFRPQDARDVADQLLTLSEELVNRFSTRTQADAVRVARQEVEIAEARVLAARTALIGFREREQALDPTREAITALEGIGRLEGALSQSRAELQERRAFMRPDNPQIQVLTNRITALAAQIATERGRITQGDENITQRLAAYERLQLEREFADRQLASATSSLENARADAQRQQIFLLRVVEPNLPEYALFPQAVFNTATVLIALTIVYAIGWLLVAGAREHAS